MNLFKKIIHRPIQVTGKSKVDSWLKPPIRKAHSAIEVNRFLIEFILNLMDYIRSFINHYILLDVVELIHGENIQFIQHHIFNEYETKKNENNFCKSFIFLKRLFIDQYKSKEKVELIHGFGKIRFVKDKLPEQ